MTAVGDAKTHAHPHQPAKPHLTATLILGCLAQFMVILDVSVVNVALPAIKHSLDFSEAGLQWVVNAYTVTFAGFLLLGGRAADLLGRRRVFVFGLLLFSASSLVGGFAQTGTMLTVARLVQGIGGAIIGPTSLSILTTTFTEPAARNRAVGTWGAMGGLGGGVGVLLGGVLTDLFSWRWILFINLPFGLIGAIAAARLLLEGRNENAARNFDVAGAVSATAGLTLIVYGIVHTDTDGWGAGITLIPIIAGVVLLALFIAIEGWLAKVPLMPLRLFRSRQLSAANLIVMMIGASTFSMWFFTTLYMQEVKGYSPLEAGLAYVPINLSLIIGSTVVTKLAFRVGPKRLLIFGMLGITLGLALFSQISVGGSLFPEILLPGIITCLAMPFGFIPGTLCATSGVDPHEAGIASAISNSARLFGGSLGLAILVTIATSHSDSLLAHHAANASHALVSGFREGLWIAAGLAFIGAVIAAVGMPPTAGLRHAPRAAAPAVEA